jgi:hypothetical protein
MKVERPPTTWEADTEVEPFLWLLGEWLLGELIALGLGRGSDLADLTLNVSNVTVEPDDEEPSIPVGDFVAVSVRGAVAWDDDVWRPGTEPTTLSLRDIGVAAGAAGAAYAYERNLGPEGSVTVFLPRLPQPS